MPLYQYYSIDASGKKKSGVIEGHNEREVKERLRLQGILVTKLESKSTVSSRQNLTGEHLLTFTIQLSQLVSAGVPLYESLVAIEEQYRGEKFHRVILSLCEQIKGGKPLSEAMAQYPGSFDRLYCSMIKAGESAGALELVLFRLNDFLQKRNKLKKQIITAMIYPAVLGGFSLMIIALLLGFVVPSIEGIFEGRQLNQFTEMVLGASHFLQNYWWIYIPLILGGGVYLFFEFRKPSRKQWVQRQLLKLPMIRTLIVQTALARFCRTMATLQAGGLTMIDSLRISREVMGNVVLEEEIQHAEEQIVEGSSLSAELGRSKWIPKMVSRMVLVGEETGKTEVIFSKVADIYEEELEKTLDRVMALAQPVILIVMGTVIGLVMLAVLLPLTDVSSFAF